MLANPQSASSSFDRHSLANTSKQSRKSLFGRDETSVTTTEKQPLWIPMLQSASKGKDLSEKHLVLLGGTSESQREFLEHLNPDGTARQTLRSNDKRRQKQDTPISNKFALGYTYHDVLDADQDDVLARLNIHMLAHSSAQFATLLQPLFTSKTAKDTLITILLDWNDPFTWARQLRQWLRLLRKVILSLDEDTKIAMEDNMNAWKEKRAGPDLQSTAQPEGIVTIGPGEWDEGLGIPLSLVCIRSEKIERLERELGWGDDQFDYLQQWLRTVLLKHGSSLVYTASFEPNSVKTLIHTSLNIQSLLKRESAKHNVIDRDKILVPPNWDSWGKIRILREGFDPEQVSNAWSVEIQNPPEDTLDLTSQNIGQSNSDAEPLTPAIAPISLASSAVVQFEQYLPNPIDESVNKSTSTATTTTAAEESIISVTPFQDFLQTQSVILDRLKAEDAASQERIQKNVRQGIASIDSSEGPGSGAVSPVKGSSGSGQYTPTSSSTFLVDTIGSHRVNVNGIDLDAEEATRRLRERENERVALRRGVSHTGSDVHPASAANINTTTMVATSTSGTVSPSRGTGISIGRGTGGGPSTPGGGGGDTPGSTEGKPSNESLHGFFANLIKKGEQGRQRGAAMGGSGSATPRRESPAPSGSKRVQD